MKLNKIIISLAAAAMALAGCQPLEKVTVNLKDSVAPVITAQSVTGETVSATYTPAQMYLGSDPVNPAMVKHVLAVVSVKGETEEEAKAVSAVVECEDDATKGVVKAEMSAVSAVIVGLGYNYGDKVAVEMVVRAQLSATASSGYKDSEEKIAIASLTLKKPASRGGRYGAFDKVSSWGVTGAIASAGLNWDGDVAMYTDGTWHVAEGVELTTSDQFKFRKDAAWTDNFGAGPDITTEPYPVTLDSKQDAGAGGKNLAVAENGVYDLLLNPEAKLYIVVKHVDDPYAAFTKASTWGVIGAIASTGNSWNADEAMTTDGTWHVCKGLDLATSDQFKFRKDAAWTDNFGAGPDITTEPFVVTLNEEQDAGAGGKNLAVPADGSYDLLLNPDTKKYKIVESASPKPFDPEKY